MGLELQVLVRAHDLQRAKTGIEININVKLYVYGYACMYLHAYILFPCPLESV